MSEQPTRVIPFTKAASEFVARAELIFAMRDLVVALDRQRGLPSVNVMIALERVKELLPVDPDDEPRGLSLVEP